VNDPKQSVDIQLDLAEVCLLHAAVLHAKHDDAFRHQYPQGRLLRVGGWVADDHQRLTDLLTKLHVAAVSNGIVAQGKAAAARRDAARLDAEARQDDCERIRNNATRP